MKYNMNINGVCFSASFDKNGLFEGHSASLVIDWMNETKTPSNWGVGKEVKLHNLSLSDLRKLSYSIDEYIQAVNETSKDDIGLRQALLTHAQKTTYFEQRTTFDRGYFGVMESLSLGLHLSDLSVNELLERIKERKLYYIKADAECIVDKGFIPVVSEKIAALSSMALDGFNAAIESIENIINHYKEEAENKEGVGNWDPKKSLPHVETDDKGDEVRTTIILDKELLKKVKFIAQTEGKTFKDKATEAFADMVEEWEEEPSNFKYLSC